MTAYATSAEYATFSGSSNVTATATATVLAGSVNTLTIGAGGGYGYTSTPAVVIATPTTGVRATASATVANGVVSVLTLLDGGSGYGVSAPTVTIDPPEDLTRLLLRASELVDDYTRTAIYDVDDDDFPTDADVIAAFRDATCAQVEFWLTSDETDDVLGPADTVSVGGLSAKGRELAPRAARILRNNHLYSNDPVAL
jgi:hypothetical protein